MKRIIGSFSGTSVLRACALATLLAATGGCVCAQENSVSDSTALRVIILPFQNLSQEAQAKDQVMPRIYEKVESLGWYPVSAETVDVALRRYRIRDTGQIGWDHAQKLRSENGSPWILLGSIDLYSSDLLQVGISARLLNSLTGDLLWADSRFAAEDETPSLLRSRKIKTAEVLMDDVLKWLFISLRQTWLRGRLAHISESPVRTSMSARILIIPFDNVSGSLHADQMVNHVALSALFQQGFDVVEPGLVNE
ncbi:MAG TPA: GNA1162 family protein, partial [bacterium]